MPESRDGRYRVYRVLPDVHHINLQAIEENRLYTVHQSGYPDALQAAVDDLRTGDLVSGTLEGNPDDEEEAWTLTSVETESRVEFGFATDLGTDLPESAWTLWERPDRTGPAGVAIGPEPDGDLVAECWVQPLADLPGGSLTTSVLTGLVPMEPWLEALPHVGEPAAEVLVLDPDDPERGGTGEFGVLLFFTTAGRSLADEFRDRYDVPRGVDTRPEFDPY
jgi:fermentation-respiration switch protein FrsA (DUF1100 family)